MLLRVLRDIFAHRPQAALPGDEAGFNQLLQSLVQRGDDAQALAVYDAAVAAGIQPCNAEFNAIYRRALAATGTPPYPLRRRTRFHQLYGRLEEALPLDGEIAECGCFRGLSSHLLLGRLRRAERAFTGRGYHIFDSFEGLSEPSAADVVTGDDAAAERVRRMCRRGWFAAPLETVRQGLARAWSKVQIMKVNGWRTLSAEVTGKKDLGVAALGATNKMYWSEYHRETMELAMDILGMEAQVLGGTKDDDEPSMPGLARREAVKDYPVTPLQASFFFSRSETIWGGTAEIQRNIVGERVLGLPKEPKPPEPKKADAPA